MPVIKLSRVVYVPKDPAPADPGDDGGLDLGGGQLTLPTGSRHCEIDKQVMAEFLDVIDARKIPLEDALERALKLYTQRLQSMVR